MKKIKSLFQAAFCASTLALMTFLAATFAGCSTTGGGGTQTEQAIITDAAYLGTLYEIQQNPGAKPVLLIAENALKDYSSGSNPLSAGTIQQILANTGQTNNVLADAAIVSFINLANSYIASNTNSVNQTAQQVSGWVATGIGEGLGNVAVKRKVTLRH